MPEDNDNPNDKDGIQNDDVDTDDNDDNDDPDDKSDVDDNDDGGKEKLPEWAEKELKEVRSEAANYRVKLREAMQKLEVAKTPEEYEAATKELLEENAKLNREILIRDIARDFELPKELADALKGATEEELKAHAEVLKKFATPQTKQKKKVVVAKGGLDPDSDADEFDPVALVQKNRTRRR